MTAPDHTNAAGSERPDREPGSINDVHARIAELPGGGPWLKQADAALDLPADQGRDVLDAMVAERRARADVLRGLAAQPDASEESRRVYAGMASWVDEGVDLVEQAAHHLGRLAETREANTGREQIDRELAAQARQQAVAQQHTATVEPDADSTDVEQARGRSL